MADKKATFSIDLEGNAAAVAAKGSAALSELQQKARGSQDTIKAYGAALRSLRGSTDDVRAAKDQLKAKINAERDAMSAANLAILKAGTSYEHLADASKKAAAAQAKLQAKKEAADLAKLAEKSQGLGRGIQAVGGPVDELRGKLSSLRETFGEAGGGMAAMGIAAAGAVLAVVALTAGVVAATVAFAKFVIEGSNAARTAGLFREAASGSATNAQHLGNQIEALTRKVPTTRDELNKLANELTRGLAGTRVSGQGIVDTFNAAAQASAALGDAAGSAITGIITRAKQVGRVNINPFELQGTGISFQDVATQLAGQLKIGAKAAQQALLYGTVKVDDAAKALRVVVEKRFGEINARRLLDIDVQLAKFKERLQGLTRDVHLEPLLNALQDFFDLFDEQKSVAGATLKSIVTILGNDLVGSLAKGEPAAKNFFKQLIIGSLGALIAFYKFRNGVRDAWKNSEALRITVESLGVGLAVIAGAAAVVVVALGAIVAATVALYGELTLLPGQLTSLGTSIGETLKGWAISAATAAADFIQGLFDGIKNGIPKVIAGVKNLAGGVKDAFKDALGIHSPSKVFAEYGAQTTEGYAQGLEGGSGRTQDAADAMTPAAPPGGARATGGGGGNSFTFTFVLPPGGGAGAQDAVKTLSEPTFRALLTKAVEDALTGAGVPTQKGAAA